MLKFLPVKNLHLPKGDKVHIDDLKNELRKMGLVFPDNVFKELQKALSIYSEY